MFKLHKSQKRARHVRRAVIIALAATIGSTAAPQAFFDPNLKPHVDHLITCIGLMISDPPTHARECGPNRVPEVIYKEDNDPSEPPVAVAPVPTPPAPTGSSGSI